MVASTLLGPDVVLVATTGKQKNGGMKRNLSYCILPAEPGAGSDLEGITARCKKAEEYILNGNK
jgi:alkylation response protein AidB-like acyl-CoA dehydrogenase